MAYKQCFKCNAVTDDDEPKCPFCGDSHFKDETILLENLISKIKKGEIAPSELWTKGPEKIIQKLKSLPR